MHTCRTPLAVHVTPFHGHISRPEGRRGPSHTDEEPRPEERGGVHTGRGALALGAWSGFSPEPRASRVRAGVRAFWHIRTRGVSAGRGRDAHSTSLDAPPAVAPVPFAAWASRCGLVTCRERVSVWSLAESERGGRVTGHRASDESQHVRGAEEPER